MARSRGKRRQHKGAGRRKVSNDVQLSRFDLSQLDEGYLAKLPEAQLRALSAKLLADLKAAHERLDQNPRNSSRPPSSQAPWERGASAEGGDDAPELQGRATEAAPAPASAPSTEADPEVEQPAQPQAEACAPSTADEASAARRPGQRPGAPGHGRTQCLATGQVVEHHPTHCARCEAALPEAGASVCHHAHHVIDLRPLVAERHALELMQTQHRYHVLTCACGHTTRAEPGHTPGGADWQVALSERQLAGPRLVALICALALTAAACSSAEAEPATTSVRSGPGRGWPTRWCHPVRCPRGCVRGWATTRRA